MSKSGFLAITFYFNWRKQNPTNNFVIYKQFPFQPVQTLCGFDHFLQKFSDFFGF